MTVLGGAGEILAMREVELVWGDASWTQGVKHRRNKPLDEVLAHFVRKAADRALREVKAQLPISDKQEP